MASFNGMLLGLMPIEHAPFQFLLLPTDESYIRSSSSQVYWIFQAEEAATITKVGFRYGDARGAPPEQIISLQGVDILGRPDNTSLTSTTFRPPVDNSWDETWQWIDLPVPIDVQRGQKLALVIEYNSGVVDISNASLYTARVIGTTSNRGGLPYAVSDTQRYTDKPVFGYGNSTKVYGNPIKSLEKTGFNSPRQVGLRFILDAEFGEVFKLAGIRWQGRPQGQAGTTYDVVLYERSAETGLVEKQRVRMRGDHAGTTTFVQTLADFVTEVYFDEVELEDLLFGTEYFVVLSPNDNTANMAVTTIVCEGTDELAALPGGAEIYYAERASTTANFSPSAVRRPLIDLIIDDWGRLGIPTEGIHVKFISRYNDNLFIEHADDKISSDIEVEGSRHEVEVDVIGNTIKSYGGFKTVELFKDPDDVFSPDFLVEPEQPIEQLKLVKWEPLEEGNVRLVFRLRAETASGYYTDIEQFVRVVGEAT